MTKTANTQTKMYSSVSVTKLLAEAGVDEVAIWKMYDDESLRPVVNVTLNALDALNRADAVLRCYAERVSDTAARVVRYLDQGSSVNSTGELQSSADGFERSCALLEAARSNASTLLRLYVQTVSAS